mgnify:CR=1 FL=1
MFHVTRKFRDHLAITSIGLTVLFSLSMVPEALSGEVIDLRLSPPPVEIGVLIDPLSVLMAIVVSVIGLFVTIFSSGYMHDDPSLTRFWFIMQLFISGYVLLVLADNFLLMFIGWEIVGLCCTYLTSFEYKKRKKAHLGLKVNNILRVGDVGLLIFILALYAYSNPHTFNFVELSKDDNLIIQLSRSGLLLVISLMFLGGVVGKAAQFPLHEWLPDMLVGTPSSSNALTECLAGPYLMARALPIFREAYVSGFNELSHFFLAVAWVGAITGFVAALTATAQRHPQRVMAYSISSVIGYMLTALGLAGLNSSMTSGYLAGTTILTIDAFVSALLILSTVFVSYAVRSEDLYNMRGFRSRLVHRGMEIAVFAMINVPPFSGFWLSNWVQTLALELTNRTYEYGQEILVRSGYGLFTLLILTGGVSAFYGLRLMGLIFSKGSLRKNVREVPKSMRISFSGLLLVTAILDISVPLLIPVFNGFFLPVVREMIFPSVFEVLIYIIPSISTVMTIIALLIGGYISHQLYISHKIDPEEVMKKFPFLTKIHAFLLNRCYIDALYYKVAYHAIGLSRSLYKGVEMEGIKMFRIRGINEFFDISVRWLSSLSRWIYPSIELGCFEKFNQRVVESVTKISGRMREVQTGVLSYNMLMMLFGTIMLALLLFMFGGGYAGAHL